MKAKEIKVIGWHTEVIHSQEEVANPPPEVGILHEAISSLTEPARIQERTFNIKLGKGSWSLGIASQLGLNKLKLDQAEADFAYTASAASFSQVVSEQDSLTWAIELLTQLIPFYDWANDLAQELKAKLPLAPVELPYFTSIATDKLHFKLYIAHTSYPNGYTSLSLAISSSPPLS